MEIQNLKDQVQELHRDLTKHHSIINTDKMGEILDRSLHIDSQIALQYSTVETMRVMFEEVCQMISRRSDLCTCPQCVRLSAPCKPVLLYANIDFWVTKPGENLFIVVIGSLLFVISYLLPLSSGLG